MKKLLKKQTKKINNAICGAAKGIYNDESWLGYQIVIHELSKVCEANQMEWEIFSSKYDQNEDGNLCRKVWNFRVTDGQREGFGIIVAAGAGTVSDPLSKYDIVAYM